MAVMVAPLADRTKRRVLELRKSPIMLGVAKATVSPPAAPDCSEGREGASEGCSGCVVGCAGVCGCVVLGWLGCVGAVTLGCAGAAGGHGWGGQAAGG